MASLTEISITTRKVVRYSVYGLILILISRAAFNLTVLIYKRLNPPPPPPPTVEFGILPKLPFTEKKNPEDLRFLLETPDGILPEFPESIPVYIVIPRTPEINALAKTQEMAKNLDFSENGKLKLENVKNVYDFPHPKNPSTLTVNIVTGMFSVSYNLQSDPSAIQTFPPGEEDAKEKAVDFFRKVDLDDKEIDESLQTVQYLRIDNGRFVDAFSQSDSQFVKVNLFRKNFGIPVPTDEDKNPIGIYPAVTSKMPEGNIWVIFGGNKQKELIAAEYRYFKVDEQRSATYPIKTADQAWNDLKNGNYYLASFNNDTSQIAIRKVYLGYYDMDSYTPYYQPVVVFEGDNNFVAFVPAVTDDYYGVKETEEN